MVSKNDDGMVYYDSLSNNSSDSDFAFRETSEKSVGASIVFILWA